MIKKTLQYKITEKDQGKTVEQFLRSKGYSHRLVVKLRNSPTGLTIGGELAFTIHRLQAGEILIATLEEENSQNIVPVELPLNIVYEDEDILVVDVGRYGFVKLQCYTPSYGFEELDTYTVSQSLFEGLWEEWLSLNVFLLAREMQLDDILYEDLFNNLPKEKQSELTGRKGYFAKKAGIIL